jgi:hypothetical protein
LAYPSPWDIGDFIDGKVFSADVAAVEARA